MTNRRIKIANPDSNQPQAISIGNLRNTPNLNGSHHLRMLVAKQSSGSDGFTVTLLPDQVDQALWTAAQIPGAPALPPNCPASLLLAELTAKRARTEKRNVLFYVHGFNTTAAEALATAAKLEREHNVIVVLFTWPSDGHVLEYWDDKEDAAASDKALERAWVKALSYLKRIQTQECPVKVSALFHSMGNWVLQNALEPESMIPDVALFDNVILAAADANNAGHEKWVDKLCVRNRVYITLNEDDVALRLSHAKLGSTQGVRLGHFLRNLVTREAVYINVTDAVGVRGENSHSYYVGTNDPKMRALFRDMVNGKTVERNVSAQEYELEYAARGFFRFK